VVLLEPGDTSSAHYGLAVDLGSTTVVSRLIDCNTGNCLSEASCYNHQIAYGTDILTRIFACKDKPEVLDQIQRATVDTITETMAELEHKTGISPASCLQMVISGNTTMIHFLIGMDPFCVFSSPYAVRADRPGFLRAAELGIPIPGYLFCYPGKSNYLGGDIISGVIATDLYRQDSISIFFDIGTNGELVIGSQDFLLCGAGAAGPALEGGVVKTGMRAADGAVDRVKLENGVFHLHVLGQVSPIGICGSGIIDLIAQLFLNGWIDLKGQLQPEKSDLIQKFGDEYGVVYAPDLVFFQSDIDEFILTKAAAATMIEYMLQESGISMDEVSYFYASGAFGKHVSKESAITIGMYPDMDRERLIIAGNTSLEGAEKLLLHRELLADLDEILEKMIYIQFGAVEDFLHMMVAAQAIPHTDTNRYPSVMQKLADLKKESGH
jgi:uncharacterized 2Fe-2S/4Fe-4S cluster protein (DUF4445 family)